VIAGIVLALAAAGCGSTTRAEPTAAPAHQEPATTSTQLHTATTTIARPTRAVDELVAVSGSRLRVRCTGSGNATVVLIPGFGDAGDTWATVTTAVADNARVCSYSRFGLGTSDPPPNPQTFATEATDLRSALRSLDEPGPYVVVGHSFGGAEAVSFTAQNPTDTAGLLLLDASPITWRDAVCAVSDNGSPSAKGFATVCEMTSSAQNNPEHLDGPAAFRAVAAIASVGNVPMTVATADRHDYPGLADGEEDRLNQQWAAGQQHWMTLSPSAQLVPVDHTGHNIQVDRPDVVIQQIERLIP
jgi:pimeloyl-ACP methyl ester carboxylesterase